MELQLDLKKARYSLIGKNYSKETVLKLTDAEVSQIWCDIFSNIISDQYYVNLRSDLYTKEEVSEFQGPILED